jgi:PAS domain S-box-containing protein
MMRWSTNRNNALQDLGWKVGKKMRDELRGGQGSQLACEGNDVMDAGTQPEYQAIVNTATDGIIVINEQGIVQSFNPAGEHIFGYTADEIIGRNVKILMSQFHHDKHDEYLSNYKRTGVAIIMGVGREVEGRRKDGSLVPLDLGIAEWNSNGHRFFTGIVRDLTYRKLFEQETHRALEGRYELEQLNQILEKRIRDDVVERETAQGTSAQAARMQALGELAGGIAHDFNNVLQAISGAADLLRGQSDRPSMIIRQMQTIESAVKRGSSITHRLLAFARRSNLRAQPLDVAAVLDDLGRLLAQTLGISVTIRIEAEASLPLMMADKGTLETVIVNLATNARDAMPRGGVLTLSATRLVVSKGDRLRHGLRPGRYIKITAADTGAGMNEATLARAADPFFSTKAQDRGTGLGLSMAKGFAEQSGGELVIESSLGNGTSVSIVLPVAETTSAMASERLNKADRPRILLVDDDSLVRGTLEQLLELSGYQVVSAADGEEAIAAFEAEGADLLLTDFAMPGMNGITLITRLQQRLPGLRAILMTGYAADATTISEDGTYRLLYKPVTITKLQAEITECLSGRISSR